MTYSPEPTYLARPNGLRLAYHHRPRTASISAPTLIFLPGYASDMTGGKALALDAWAAAQGHAILRFDYSGCGASEGAFEDGTLEIWRDDALFLIDALVLGPVILVGSSMGGWLALLLALKLGPRVKALVGIGAAPDFTHWGFTRTRLETLKAEGRLLEYSDYDPKPTLYTLAFWESGERCQLLTDVIPIDCPVRLLQGQQDPDVPWKIALRLASALRSADVLTLLIKDGDHRLSRLTDIAQLIATIAALPEMA